MRRFTLLLAMLIGLLCAGKSAWAEDFNLPGVDGESQAYAQSLSARFPAGGTAQARRQAEQQIDAATRKSDWQAAVVALETRIGLGEAAAYHWLSLAQAHMRRTPPEARRALQAGWQAFTQSDAGKGEIPPLLLIADALRRLDRPAQAILALEAAVERAPDDTTLGQSLADLRKSVGVLVKRVRMEPEADPARACLEFTVAPARRDDFHPRDWVKLEPAPPGSAITREGDQLCASGLPSGITTRLTLRAGMPGEGGLTTMKETSFSLAMANRRPRIDFDTRLFVLPAGQVPALSVATVNLSDLKLTLARLTERNIAAFLRDSRLGQPVDSWEADAIGERSGRVVWEGKAAIPKWEPNRVARTALPLPEAMAGAGPGLFALIARPGDGTRGGMTAVQMILRTDLAPTVWRGADGLTIQVRGFSDALPRPNVALRLLADNNDILAETTTDSLGVGRFPVALLRGEGPLAPRAVHAFGAKDDFALLDLNNAAFDLSDRGVAGLPQPGPLDAFVWLDRGIYRPGETVRVMALLRDDAGQPANVPTRLIVRRPNGQVFLEAAAPLAADASIHLPVTLSSGAPSGTWTVELRADPARPPIGSTSFRVDAFVPDRMAVDLGPVGAKLVVGQPYALPVAARFLYGAPGADLTGKASFGLVVDPAPFPTLSGYRIGLEDEIFAPDRKELTLEPTDARGQTRVNIALPRAPDTTRALKAAIDVTIDDPAGRGSRAAVEIPLRPGGNLIGIRPAFAGNAIDAGAEAGFDLLAVDPDGKPIATSVKLRLVRERPDWRLVMRGSLARYETVWKDEPLHAETLSIAANAPVRFTRKLDFGRYRLEVTEAGGMAATSLRFRAGWVATDNPDVPDQVDVSADRKTYAPGQTARIHVVPPFAGSATLLVLTDKVHALRTLDIPAGGADLDIPVDPAWGPGAYVALHVFRPAADAKSRPGRAIGVTWVGIDPGGRTIPLAFETPAELPPRARSTVRVKAEPGAWVSLAAVDEGILRLTNFASPEPNGHFLGRRRLGLDIRDDWGRLIAPADGEATALRQGGDEGGFVLPDIPQKTVTLFVPPVQAGADGIATFALDLPDFAGQVRLMAVGWNGARIGSAATAVLVRDRLIAEPLLPRFLSPGDEARLAVLLHNLDLPAGDAAVSLSVDGPLRLIGPERLTATLAKGARALPATVLAATGIGRGTIRLDVTGPDGFTVRRETAISVRSARAPVTLTAGGELAPNVDVTLSPPIDKFLAGSWRASASFGGAVRYDVAAVVRALDAYAWRCLEQTVSRGLPLALLPDGETAGPDRAERLQQAVNGILDQQRFDGGFGLWSASGGAEPWLSSYATEFLLRARSAGAAIPEIALKDALKFIAESADEDASQPNRLTEQAYRLYVLAFAGQGRPGAARVMAERINQLPTPLARAQLGAALALAHDQKRAEAAFGQALALTERKPWSVDYGSALRDQAAIAVLLRESGLLSDRLARLLGALPGGNLAADTLNTQEQAWTAAAGAVLGRGLAPVSVSLGGVALPPASTVGAALSGPIAARNTGTQPVWYNVSVTGIPAPALPASRDGMRVSRQFMTLDGQPLNLDTLRQNTVFVLLIEGRAEDKQDHRALVRQGLPAGWEIAGRFGGGEATGMAWLGKLSETESQPAADDRFAAVVGLTSDQPGFRVAVRLRAVTPGVFELPGADLVDMYRPAVFARQNTGRIVVQPAD